MTRLLQAAAAVWTLAVVTITLAPSPPGDAPLPHTDKIVHVGGFLGMGFLGCAAGVPVRVVLIAGMLLAVGTEVGQGVVPWPRTPDALDAVADVVGLLLGVLGWWVFDRRRHAKAPRV